MNKLTGLIMPKNEPFYQGETDKNRARQSFLSQCNPALSAVFQKMFSQSEQGSKEGSKKQ